MFSSNKKTFFYFIRIKFIQFLKIKINLFEFSSIFAAKLITFQYIAHQFMNYRNYSTTT
jgi:hypothetical protein